MRLSEAIRLGAMMKPQHYDKTSYFKRGGFLRLKQCSCVMGAAIDAVNLDVKLLRGDGTFAGWPETWIPILKLKTHCPACDVLLISVLGTLAHLNDHHHWIRERIADWVETIENAQDAATIVDAELDVDVEELEPRIVPYDDGIVWTAIPRHGR